jgi:hypothetical protein
MAKYRKKPVIVEAEQWWPGKHVDGVIYPVPNHEPYDADKGLIETSEGPAIIFPGDYIITDEYGDKYVCSQVIFEMMYEPVGDDKEA